MKPTPEGYFDRPVCQPVDFQGDGNGILLMHGFTGSPAHMRMLADDLAERGYTVRSICLPGHASTEEDMAKESWQSWLQAAKTAVLEMKKTCKTVTVCGLSMGGVLAGQQALANQLAYLLPFAIEQKLQLLQLDAPLQRLELIQHLLDRMQGEMTA